MRKQVVIENNVYISIVFSFIFYSLCVSIIMAYSGNMSLYLIIGVLLKLAAIVFMGLKHYWLYYTLKMLGFLTVLGGALIFTGKFLQLTIGSEKEILFQSFCSSLVTVIVGVYILKYLDSSIRRLY